MNPSVLAKLDTLQERFEELAALLSDPDTIADLERFRGLSREYAELEDVVSCHRRLLAARQALADAEELQQEGDAELRALAVEEAGLERARVEELEQQLQRLLLPRDPRDRCNVFLEVRAGTGGDEAALFAGDLFRMYARYAERQGWQVEPLSERPGDHGGYKEIIARVSGSEVYSRLKFESGAHRVQRVPETESQGRVHTSACTVAVLPEVEDIDEVIINRADLRVDTFRASGAGGQHVNRTDSAVRLTHLPTGLVVECQDERSQHKNRARAMALLAARLLDRAQAAQQAEQAAERRQLVGSGDRSERIRTYNFPQGRITDHRINLTLYDLESVLDGALEEVIHPLLQEHQADLLAAMGDE